MSIDYEARREDLRLRWLDEESASEEAAFTGGVDHLALICWDMDRTISFYTEIMGARAELSARNGSPSAKVWAGPHQHLHFTETDGEIPAYDGHHFQIYISDFSGPYDKLMDMDLITMESNQHEWRFKNIVDPDTGEVLYEVEHEVRSVTNPLYSRPLINRNPVQRNTNYRRGHDGFPGTI